MRMSIQSALPAFLANVGARILCVPLLSADCAGGDVLRAVCRQMPGLTANVAGLLVSADGTLAALVKAVAPGRANGLGPFLAAPSAPVIHRAVGAAGGLGAAALGPVVAALFFAEVRGDHNAVGVRVARHRKGQGGAAAGAAVTHGPVIKLPAVVRHGGHGRAALAFFDLLAGRALDVPALAGYKLHRHPGAAHRDGVLADQPRGHPLGLGHRLEGLGPGILGDVGVGADVLEEGGHPILGEVHPIAEGIVLAGPAGGRVLEGLAGVQELVALLLAHGGDGRVKGVHLLHREVAVLPLPVQRGHRAHNDVGVFVRLVDGGKAVPVALDKALGAAA